MRKKHTPWPTMIDTTYCALLLQKLEPHLSYKTYPPGQRFTMQASTQTKSYLIKTGAISLSRQPDDLLLDYLPAPTIRGIIPINANFGSSYTFKVFEEAEIAILELEEFYTLLTRYQLWETFARHLQLISSITPEIIFRLNSRTVYSAVRIQLYELMSKPESIRSKIVAEVFIREKVQASRSAVTHILSELKKGGYIIVEDGSLIEIKNIPEKF